MSPEDALAPRAFKGTEPIPSDFWVPVLWQAMRPVLIGATVGVTISAAVSGILSGLMFGLGTHDAIAFISVPVFLPAIAFPASFIPGRRAMRVDPIVALRCE